MSIIKIYNIFKCCALTEQFRPLKGMEYGRCFWDTVFALESPLAKVVVRPQSSNSHCCANPSESKRDFCCSKYLKSGRLWLNFTSMRKAKHWDFGYYLMTTNCGGLQSILLHEGKVFIKMHVSWFLYFSKELSQFY